MATHLFANPSVDNAIKGSIIFGLVARREPDDMRWEVASHLHHMTDAELRRAYLASRAMSNVLGLEIERRKGR
jgi:hypothetical protein